MRNVVVAANNSGPCYPLQGETSKAKKVRRKRRMKKKNGAEEGDQIELYDCQTLSKCLKIDAVHKNICSIYLKKRNRRFKYIKILSYKRSNVPAIFESKKNMLSGITESLPKMAVNDAASSKSPKRPIRKSEKPKEENRKHRKKRSMLEKKPHLLKGYISQDSLESGLEQGSLIRGFIRINPKNYREAYVSSEDRNTQDYLILNSEDRNGAMEGDEVALEIKPESEWREGQKTASVVYILKKVHPRFTVGYLQLMPDKNKLFAYFTPRDTRVPRLRIPHTSWPSKFYHNAERYENTLFVAKILEWRDEKFATGILTECLGVSGELKAETEAILRENGLDVTPYTEEETNVCLKHFKEVDEEEMGYREDLRDECVFTVDPLTARDLDDAVSCKILPNGNLRIGVHISDVAFYLDEGTILDQKASRKATTIYLVANTYHMLPLQLCMECSLLPGSEKRAFSVLWEITPDGEVLHTRFTCSLIKSCTKLAYEHAQTMIENPETEDFPEEDSPDLEGFTWKEVSSRVNTLNRIAKILRRKRFENGALRLDQPKVVFTLSPENGEPEDWSVYEQKDAHRMIEEFMLLANVSVAQRIREDFPDLAFLRRHEPPITYMLEDTKNSLETAGIFLDTSSSGALQSTFSKYCSNDPYGEAVTAVLTHLLTKPMKRAAYFCASNVESDQGFHHYALNIPLYTHFTSPIRRYADVMVHRLLAASLGYSERPDWTIKYVEEITDNCNAQKYNAKKAGDASVDLYLAHYVEAHQPFVEVGVVIDVKDKMFEVLILKTGSVVRVNTNDFHKNIKWKATEIPNASVNSDSENGKRLWRMEVIFPPLALSKPVTLIIERFSRVTVALTRKGNTNKLEARLVPPVPTLIFQSCSDEKVICSSSDSNSS